MIKKILSVFCLSMLLATTSQAGALDTLFAKHNAQSLRFDMCEQGDSDNFAERCRDLDSSYAIVFSQDHSVSVKYGSSKSLSKWKTKGNEVLISQPGKKSFKDANSYALDKGKYLVYVSEESGDVQVYLLTKIQKK